MSTGKEALPADADQGSGALRCAVGFSTESDTARAIEQATALASAQLDARADLAVVFVSRQHQAAYDEVADYIAAARAATHWFGATAETVLAAGREFEDTPAVAVWLARLPGAALQPLRLDFERAPDGGTITGWPASLEREWPTGAALLLLADPYTFPADFLLERLNDDRPGVPVVGGMASAANQPGQNRLWIDGQMCDHGAVGVLVSGDVEIEPIVSQGCRPVGQPLLVTQAERNVIGQLGGMPALARVQEVYSALSEEDQLLAQRGLHVGRVINEYQESFERGDFLIRNVVGADRESGAIAIGDYVRAGQTIQFHVRDEHSADEDLVQLLNASQARESSPPAAALVFTCNGRGTRLFSQPNHDAAALHKAWPGLPVAGFFAQGELGPVGGKNFVHGFTASIALLRRRAGR